MKAIFKLPENNIKASFSIPAGGGTYDYERLRNKPSINEVELIGNKTSEELGLASIDDIPTLQDLVTPEQLEAINSGATSTNIAQISTNAGNIILINNTVSDLSSTVQSNYTILDNKIDTTQTTLQGNINTLSGTVTSNYNDLTQSITNNVSTLNTRITNEVSTLNGSITNEATTRQNADNNLQSQIDAITASSDVTDIVGTYAQLQAYNTTGLAPNSIIKVLQDESQNYETTYYRWVITNGAGSWVLIGEEGPYYTKSQVDSTFVPQTRTVNGYALSNNITLNANDVGAIAPSDLATVATTGDYDDLIDKPIPPVGYGTSSTAAKTATKVVSIPEITELNVGQVIIVKPSATSSVANSKIELNDFEAYNMRYNNANITTSTASIVWTANVASMFIFDGTYWQFLGHGLDINTNTTYASMSVNEGITGTATAARSLTATNLKQIIQGTKLKGLVTTDDADVVASDSITIGIGKLQAQSTETKSILNDKQDTLVSGTNIKTINNESLLGSGNITIQGGGGGAVDSVNGQTGTVVLTASDVGALADTTTIPSKTSDLTNDSGFITGITSNDVKTALGYTPYNSTNPDNFITSADLPTNYVTTDTVQDITAKKTFIGDKAINFKQATTADKLGFTLYNPSNIELGALEYRPNTISGSSLLSLNCPQTTGDFVGFRYWGTPAVNIVAPKVATAGNYYIPINFTNGTNTVTSNNVGTVNISTLIPTIATSVSSSSTNAQTVGAKLFYDTVGNIETLLSNV